MDLVQQLHLLREMEGVGMSSNIVFHNFDSTVDLTDRLSEDIAKTLQGYIDKNGHASLIVSGGNTPISLFKKLRRKEIEWEKVQIGLCDERWIDSSSENSNENLVRTHLLQEEAGRAKFIGMYIDGKTIQEARDICNSRYNFEYDLLILGMGSDAHTASLFPNNPKLKLALDLKRRQKCIDIEPSSAPFSRLTLTLSAILSAKNIYLHFEGDSKFKIFKEAMEGKDIYDMPIRSILHQDKKIIEVYYS